MTMLYEYNNPPPPPPPLPPKKIHKKQQENKQQQNQPTRILKSGPTILWSIRVIQGIKKASSKAGPYPG